MSDALVLSGIHHSYNPGEPNEVRVLTGADLTVKAGEVVALVAPSGSGKSTLLHIAGLLDQPQQGAVAIAGAPCADLADRERTAIRRTKVGFVYQFHHLMQEFSARENIMLPQRAAGASSTQASERAMDLLGAVGLVERADHRPAELSGGEAQRVAICRGLANRPRLLLADEPTGNLDPETSDQVFAMLTGVVRKEGLGALIATHNLDLATRMDRVVKLRNGAIIPA